MNPLLPESDAAKHRRVVSTITEHSMRFLQRQFDIFTPSKESANLNEYLYSKDTSKDTSKIITKLVESNDLSEKYTRELKTQVLAAFDRQIAKINQSRARIRNTIIQKKQNLANEKTQNEVDTVTEEKTLSMVQRLPDELVKYIFAFVYTQSLRLILYRQTPVQIESITAKIKQQHLKIYLKNLSKRTRAISKMICDLAEMKGFIKFDDYAQLKNMKGGQTKSELTSQVKKLTHCYEYIHNIVQHKSECNELTNRIAQELLHIYQSNIYIAQPRFNRRKKTSKPATQI